MGSGFGGGEESGGLVCYFMYRVKRSHYECSQSVSGKTDKDTDEGLGMFWPFL